MNCISVFFSREIARILWQEQADIIVYIRTYFFLQYKLHQLFIYLFIYLCIGAERLSNSQGHSEAVIMMMMKWQFHWWRKPPTYDKKLYHVIYTAYTLIYRNEGLTDFKLISWELLRSRDYDTLVSTAKKEFSENSLVRQ